MVTEALKLVRNNVKQDYYYYYYNYCCYYYYSSGSTNDNNKEWTGLAHILLIPTSPDFCIHADCLLQIMLGRLVVVG